MGAYWAKDIQELFRLEWRHSFQRLVEHASPSAQIIVATKGMRVRVIAVMPRFQSFLNREVRAVRVYVQKNLKKPSLPTQGDTTMKNKQDRPAIKTKWAVPLRDRIALALILATVPPIQAACTNPGSFPINTHYAPISDFKLGGTSLTFQANPAVVAWSTCANIRIAWKVGLTNNLVSPSSCSASTGLITINATATPYIYSAVSLLLRNNFPLQTHFDSTNKIARVGATGIIRQVTVQASSNPDHPYPELEIATCPQFTPDKHLDAEGKPAPGSTYLYKAGSGQVYPNLFRNQAAFPSYGDFGGQGIFALAQYSDEAAVWYGSRNSTSTDITRSVNNHWPVVWKNAYDSTGKFLNYSNVLSNAPVIQVINNVRTDSTGFSSNYVPGRALVSFVLPPYWNRSALPNSYPTLYNGAYDLSVASGGYAGLANQNVLRTIVDMYDQNSNYKVVGIIQNGTGADARPNHIHAKRAFDTYSAIFDHAATKFKIDQTKVVAYGASAGAMMAAYVASNPEPSNYKVKYAILEAPIGKPSTALSFGGDFRMASWLGWSLTSAINDLWRSGSTHNHNGVNMDAQDKMYLDMFGFMPAHAPGGDKKAYADSISPYDSTRVNAMLAKGTKVEIIIGTNDGAISTQGQFDYVDKLRTAGVAVRLNVAYRGGHKNLLGWTNQGSVYACKIYLTKIFNADASFIAENRYWMQHLNENGAMSWEDVTLGRSSFDDPFPAITTNPTTQPMWLDIPIIQYTNRPASFMVSGGAGTYYRVTLQPMVTGDWESNRRTVTPIDAPTVFTDQLPMRPDPLGKPLVGLITSAVQTYGTSQAGYFFWKLEKSSNGVNFVNVGTHITGVDVNYNYPSTSHAITQSKAIEEPGLNNWDLRALKTTVSNNLESDSTFGLSER